MNNQKLLDTVQTIVNQFQREERQFTLQDIREKLVTDRHFAFVSYAQISQAVRTLYPELIVAMRREA